MAYTKEQLLSTGKELTNLLIDLCNSANNISGFLKEYIALLTSDTGIYKKQQQAMSEFAESGENTQKQADKMMQTSQINSEALQAICTEFQKLNQIITGAQAGRKEMDRKVKKLDEKIKSIGLSIRNIQEVSEQTKLLSFNASIEAARAGNAGKGFRIIANEVKTLSARTKTFTSEIESKVQEIEEEVNTIVAENHAHDEFMDSLQKTAVDSGKRLEKIQDDDKANMDFLRNILNDMENSQKKIIKTTKEAEKANIAEVKRIAARAAKNTIQTGDQLSFLFELRNLFNYIEKGGSAPIACACVFDIDIFSRNVEFFFQNRTDLSSHFCAVRACGRSKNIYRNERAFFKFFASKPQIVSVVDSDHQIVFAFVHCTDCFSKFRLDFFLFFVRNFHA